MLTVKILFTIDSLKKRTISSKHYFQFFSLKKIKNISFQLKKSISIFKKEKNNLFSRSIAFLIRKSLKKEEN